MQRGPDLLSSAPPGPCAGPEADVLSLCAAVSRTVAVAEALVRNRRQVCVAGLQDQVGLLCARALDLEPGRKGLLRVEMKRLADRLATLEAGLRRSGSHP